MTRSRRVTTLAAIAVAAAAAAHASVVAVPCEGCAERLFVATATREVAPGDYVHEDDPACAAVSGVAHPQTLWKEVERYAAEWRGDEGAEGAAAAFAGPVLRPATDELARPSRGVRIEGDLGRALSGLTQPSAACAILAVVVPRGAIVDGITFEAAEASHGRERTWHACAGDSCLEGWSRFEAARQFPTPSGALLVATLFKNWSHDRARRARLNVAFIPPPGWVPPEPHAAETVLEFPSEAAILADDAAVRRFLALAEEAPPVELRLRSTSPFALQLAELYGLPRPLLSRVAVGLRNLVFTLNGSLRRRGGDELQAAIERRDTTILVPAIPSYSPDAAPVTDVLVSADVWFAAAWGEERPAAPRWLPPSSRPLGAAVRRVVRAGRSDAATPRLLRMKHDEFFLRDAERVATIDRSVETVLAGPLEIDLAAAEPPVPPPSLATIAAELRPRLDAAGRAASLYVLDTGWPTAADRDAAFAWLGRVLATIPGAAPAPSPGCPFAPLAGSGGRHAEHIAHTIAPLEAADPRDRVAVIYLPVNSLQCGAKPFLEALVAASVRQRFPSFTAQEAAGFAAGWVAAMGTPNPNSLRLATDRVVVDSYLDSLDRLHGASPARGAYLLNTSWTIGTPLLKAYGNPRQGAIVTAVGNRGDSFKVFDWPTEFVSRALDGERVIAVTCPKTSAPQACTPSNTAPPAGAHALLLLRFEGTTASAGCGTSFASPRVAWLLAAADALRTGAQASWPAWLRSVVGSSRGASSDLDWSLLRPHLGL